jgi:hypothetical protein
MWGRNRCYAFVCAALSRGKWRVLPQRDLDRSIHLCKGRIDRGTMADRKAVRFQRGELRGANRGESAVPGEPCRHGEKETVDARGDDALLRDERIASQQSIIARVEQCDVPRRVARASDDAQPADLIAVV